MASAFVAKNLIVVLSSTKSCLSSYDICQKVEPQISGGDSNSANEGEIIEGLMQIHDVTLSNLRSRLTKLQVTSASH